MKRIQDWEVAASTPDSNVKLNWTEWDWDTIDIQIDTEKEAIARAHQHAKKTGSVCVVNTSIRIENDKGTEVLDRDLVPSAVSILVYPDGREETV